MLTPRFGIKEFDLGNTFTFNHERPLLLIIKQEYEVVVFFRDDATIKETCFSPQFNLMSLEFHLIPQSLAGRLLHVRQLTRKESLRQESGSIFQS